MLQFDFVAKAYVPLLTALHAQSFDSPWTNKAFDDILSLPTTVGFVNEAGFILCSVVLEEAEILTLCVHPQQRRKGIATALLQRMETYLKEKGVKEFFLDVRSSNKAALQLYHHNGFVQISLRKGYYKTPLGQEDALILKKEL